ncbi:hypothetical protein OAN21_00030 [Alphaproteobacteria bacterium]|nr:hypothetical protein [Alphaproteobacteria bacterium]
MSKWPGSVRKHHISVINFEDPDGIIAENLGGFLKYIDPFLRLLLQKKEIFKGSKIEAFPSQHTGDIYHTLQSTKESGETLRKAETLLQRFVLKYIETKKGLLPTARSAAAGLNIQEIKGFPHLSLTKNQAPPAKFEKVIIDSKFNIIGFQVIYTFEAFDQGTEGLVRVPQIFIEKWFEDPSFYFQTKQFNVLEYKNETRLRVSNETHISSPPLVENIRINLSKMESLLPPGASFQKKEKGRPALGEALEYQPPPLMESLTRPSGKEIGESDILKRGSRSRSSISRKVRGIEEPSQTHRDRDRSRSPRRRSRSRSPLAQDIDRDGDRNRGSSLF